MFIRFDQAHGRVAAPSPWFCTANAPAFAEEIVAFGLSVHQTVTRCERSIQATEHEHPILEQIVLPHHLLPLPPGPMDDIEVLLEKVGLQVARRLYRIRGLPAPAAPIRPNMPQSEHGILQFDERLIDPYGRVILLRRMSCHGGTITLV